MKFTKTIIRITFFSLASMLLLILASCGPKVDPFETMNDTEKAAYLSEKSDEYYKDGFAAAYTVNTKLAGSVNSTELSSESIINGEYTVLFPGTTSIAVLDKAEIDTTTKSGVFKPDRYISTQIEGFVGGNTMIYAYAPDEALERNPIYYKCTCTPEEYLKSLEIQTYSDMGDVRDMSIEKLCKKVSVEKSEDGAIWTLTYSELDTDSETFKNLMRIIKSSVGSYALTPTVKSISVVMKVDSDTLALQSTSMEMNMDLEGDSLELQLELGMDMTFSRPDSNLTLTPENLDDYVDNSALIYKDAFISLYNAKSRMEGGSFTFKTFADLEYKYGGSGSYSETDNISFGTVGGKFCYDIAATVKSNNQQAKVTIKYDGETETTTVSGQSQTAEKTEDEARTFIYGLLQQNTFSSDMIKSIACTSSTESTISVTFRLHPTSKSEAAFSGLTGLGYLKSSTEEVTIKVDDNMNLISVLYEINGNFDRGSYNYKTFICDIVESELVFDSDSLLSLND